MFMAYRTGEKVLLGFFLLINIVSFIVYGLDKGKAIKGRMRVPESSLILLALVGGGLGSLMAMTVFSHKLSKKKFKFGVPLIIIFNILVLVFAGAYLR